MEESKVIFISNISPLPSLLNRGLEQLVNGLLVYPGFVASN